MYLSHFKLNAKPFAMNPDPAFLYESAQHAAALTMLEYAMESEAPFCLLTGEIGSGKTTLIHRLLRMVDKQVTVGLVSNTQAGFRSIYPWVMSALFLIDDDPSDLYQFESLKDFFVREFGRGRRTLLIFDEAQNLSIKTLEQLRLLSNVNSENHTALQIMLVGQPELRRKLAKPRLKQLAQRINVDFHLNALTLPEAGAYVRHRLKAAGGSEAIFLRQAIALIHEHSGGIPRVMNQLCDLCLVYAFAEGIRQITPSLVEEVLADQMLAKTPQPATSAAYATKASDEDVGAAGQSQPPPKTVTMSPVQPTLHNPPQPEATIPLQTQVKPQAQPQPQTVAISQAPPEPRQQPRPEPRAAQPQAQAKPEPRTQPQNATMSQLQSQALPQPEAPTLSQAQPGPGTELQLELEPEPEPQPRIRRLPLYLDQPSSAKGQPRPIEDAVVETVSQPPRKLRTLPLHIGEAGPNVGDLELKKKPALAKKDPVLEKMGQLQSKKDRLQMKKRRSTSGWSWFFFS